MALRMSVFEMRPPAPLPVSCRKSTLCSLARRRTSGEVRMPISRSLEASKGSSPPTAAGGMAAFGGGATAAGFASALGGGGAAAFGASFAGAAAAAGAPPSSSTPTTVLIWTVAPSLTRISLSVPEAGAGISASTLSVEISKSGSSRSTLSPTFFSHLVTVPSKIDSPICGISTFVGISDSFYEIETRKAKLETRSIAGELARGRHHLRRVREEVLLERRRVWHGRIERSYPDERRVQVLKRLLHHNGGNLAGNSSRARVFVHDQHPIGLAKRRQDGRFIERQQSPQVYHFALQSVFFGELLGGFEAGVGQGGVADHGQVLAFAAHRRLPERNHVVVLGDFLLDAPVEELVLEEKDGVVIAHRRLDESLGVVGGGRADHFQSGRVHEIHLRVRGVEGPAVHAAARGAAQDHRHGRAPTIVAFGDEVGNLVEGAGDEVDELELRHRAQAEVAHPDRGAHDGAFADGRVNDALAAEAREEAFGHLEGAAVDADVFAQHHHRRVALHFFPEPAPDRLQVGHRGHQGLTSENADPSIRSG